MKAKFHFPARIVAGLLLLAASALNAASAPTQTPIPASPAAIALSPEKIQAFRDYLARARQEAGLPGLAVVLVQPGKVLLLEGFGIRSTVNAAPVTPDTRFALGPATQALNSLLLSCLATQHVFDLDAPARHCWDDFKFTDPVATRAVSLRHLLTMTGGIAGTTDHLLLPARATPNDLFTALAQLPVLAQPGETFSYSEASPAAAGYLAVYAVNRRRAPETGLPAAYAALAKAKLLDPLGMTRATFDPPSSQPADNDAVGHTRDANGTWHPDSSASTSVALLPARGLRASARDVAAWLQCELSGGLAADGSRLLAENDMQQRWHPVAARNSQQYGMGWSRQFYHGVEIITRSGESGNQAELVVILPQYRTALAILANGSDHAAGVFMQDALLNLADMFRESIPEK